MVGSINIEKKANYILLSEKLQQYTLGDLKDNKLLYLKRAENEKYNTIYSYDLIEKKESAIISLQDKFQEIKSPVFDNSGGIYFIGNKAKEESEFNEDIYYYNTETKQLRQITFSSNIKEGLTFYKR